MDNHEETQAADAEAMDPREQMRLALQRKKQGQHPAADGQRGEPDKGARAAAGPAGAKKQFTRRKAGG